MSNQEEVSEPTSVKGNYKGPIEKDPTKFHIEKKPIAILGSIIDFIKSIFSIKDGLVSYAEVVKETKEGVTMTGYNVWILMCSIAIASVGLNVNSTAVIVGAMLISPLMGPIRGIGLGIGINDFTLLIRSLKNLGITVGVSLTISFVYFLVSPIETMTEQLFIRTEPTFLDVVVAFVGGLAGVIAVVKGKKDTVIPGVAIATALMPPLCTGGYGLAVGNFNYFFGASYLFLINSVLIALSTLLIVRYFNFPKREYVDPKIESKVRAYIVVFMVVVVAPSGYLFYKMTKKNIFEANSYEFVEQVVKPNTKGVVTQNTEYGPDSSYIDLIIQGDIIDENTKLIWENQLAAYNLTGTHLHIFQGGDYKTFIDERLKDVLEHSSGGNDELVSLIVEKDSKLAELTERMEALQNHNNKSVLDFRELISDFKIDHPYCSDIYINQQYSSDSVGIDTTYTLFVKLKKKMSSRQKDDLKKKMASKLVFKLKNRNYHKQDSVPVYIF
ncbi:MAG: TIGR00341 family protein [Crocinitomicaceae bacterium]